MTRLARAPIAVAPVLALLLALALAPAAAQPMPDTTRPLDTEILAFPFVPPLFLLLPQPANAALQDDAGCQGTESFELLQEHAAEANAALLKVPDGIFTGSKSDKERSERIAREALPRKEEPTLLENILAPLAAAAAEALDSAY